MKKDSGLYKKIKIYCYIVGLIAFLTAFFISVFGNWKIYGADYGEKS